MEDCDIITKVHCAKDSQRNETRIDSLEHSLDSIKKVITTVDTNLSLEMKVLSKGLSDLAISLNIILTKLDERSAKATEVAAQNQTQFDKLNKRIDEIEEIVTDTKVIESKLANLEKILYGFIGLCVTTGLTILLKPYF
jgi:chromosome segregation ATPase